MKIIFAFRTRLFRLSAFPARSAFASRSVPASFRKILSLFAMQLSIFFPYNGLPATAVPSATLFSLGVLPLPSLLPLRPLLALSLSLRPSVSQRKNVGGLKWTRTIDLTLIRRVL